MNTRRAFLRLSAAVASGSLLPHSMWASRIGGKVFTPGTLDGYQQGLLSRASLEKYVGSLFLCLLDDDKTAYMHLHSVQVVEEKVPETPPSFHTGILPRTRPQGQLWEFYKATFLTGGDGIPQDTYVLDHGRLGRNAVFLVPGMDKQGRNTAVATFATMKA